jgi:hypothetical protein
MTRMSKPARRRAVSPRRRQAPAEKTGTKKNDLPLGYKEHANAVEGKLASQIFIRKVG